MAEFDEKKNLLKEISLPTIFDLVFVEGLSSTLEPAFKYFLNSLAESSRFLSGVCHYSDEIYLVVNYYVQKHFLKEYGSTFAENFYGLRRVSRQGFNKGLWSFSTTSYKSLIWIVLFPYLRGKIERKFEDVRADIGDGITGSNYYISKVKRIFVAIYPYVHFGIEATTFIFYLLYALEKSLYFSPKLFAAGAFLIRKSVEDQLERKEDLLNDHSFLLRLKYSFSKILIGLLATSVEFGAFFLQFLRWWYSEANVLKNSLNTLPTPKPPKSINSYQHLAGRCPICLQIRRNPTVLSVSGLVFCYSCILKYVRENQHCPVTKYSASEKQLIRIVL